MRTTLMGAVALALGACGSSDSSVTVTGGYSGGPACGELTTCGACTPVNGCGWCFGSAGAGTCATGPDGCPASPAGWTWDPGGCRVSADASVAPLTAQAPAEAGTASAGEAGNDASVEASGSDGASTSTPDGSSRAASCDVSSCPACGLGGMPSCNTGSCSCYYPDLILPP